MTTLNGVKLYSYWRSSSAWRVRIALALKSVPHELVTVNLVPAVSEQRQPRFAELNPLHQIPVLEWTDAEGRTQRLAQSVAIIEYLEETLLEPALLPRDSLQRAHVRQAVEIVNSGTQPHHNVRVLTAVRQLSNEARAQQWAHDAIAEGLDALESLARHRAGRFSVGDALSLADVYLVPHLYNARRFGVGLSRFARLVAIESRVAMMDAFVHAHPSRQPDAPHEEDA